jgi:hypothetical protein
MMLGRTAIFTMFMVAATMPSVLVVVTGVLVLMIHLLAALMPKERKA